MKFGLYTFGCKTNQYETQAMERLLTEMGHEIADFEKDCDAYIINTCSVTAVADRKNRTLIRRCRREHPDAVIAVCGCYSQHDAQTVRELGVDVLGGSGNRREFLEAVLEAVQTGRPGQILDEALRRREFEVLPAGGLSQRTRAMLKVQDGCVNFCTYCIIPYTRGPVRSAPLALIRQQVEELDKMGYREVVITGIEIAGWGMDLPGKPPMTDMVAAVCETAPRMRVRLGSLEPRVVTEEFCQKLKQYKNLCPHFHLSMQSGSDTVLARMKRKYDTARYLQSVELLKQHFPGCAVTTDMIVAFPGETEEEFDESLAFIWRCGFADMHIFPYSRRPGTPADKMPGQHSNAVKSRRSYRAIELADRMNRRFRENMADQVVEVLFEEEQEGLSCGHAENYVKVYAHGQDLHNQIRRVKILFATYDGVLGELCDDE